MSDPDHARLLQAVARHFFGEPNQRLSKKCELRFGNNGSLSIDLKNGAWFDHEAKKGGGPLDLIMRETGISEPREAYAWAEQQGYWINGDAPEGAPGPLGREIAHYPYVDEGGELLLQVVRYAPKTFRQRRPDGKGGWIWNIKGVRRVPYRLPELLEALGNEQTIFIAEGEKDTDNLHRLGAPATCSLGGAGKWHVELNQHFAGASVVIIGDRDQAGRDHVRDVAAKLMTTAARVRVLDLGHAWPQCPDKGDVSDWIAAGLTIERLNALVEQLPTWNADEGNELGEWDAGDDPGPIPPRPWLLGNQFCCGFISSLFAAGGVGKSALRLVQFISLALGRSLCGQHIFRRSRVLLISLEDDRDELERRIAGVLIHFGVQRSELKGWLFCSTPTGSKLAELQNNKRVPGKLEQQIRGAIARRKPDLVALDPFIKLHDLGENDSGDMNFVCGLLTRIAIESKIAVDVPHHIHKGQVVAGDADSGRGSSGIRDAGRLIFTLTIMSAAEAQSFNIEPDQRFSYVRLDSAKVNIAARSGAASWFRIVGVPIGNTTAEYPAGDTIQVAEPWTPPDAWAGLSYATLNAILDCIDAGIRDDDSGQPTGERFSNAPAAKERAVWPVVQRFAPDKSEAQCRTIIHQWLTNGALVPEQYDSPEQRRKVSGLRVEATKRPGTTTET